MKYEIICIGTDEGWKYRIFLFIGRNKYSSEKTYISYTSAERAAKATGAIKR